MAVVKDPLQLKALYRLQFKDVFLHDMMARIERFSACILGVKESEQMAFGFQHGLQTLHQRLYQGLRQIVGYVPEQNGVELARRLIHVLGKEPGRINLSGPIFLHDGVARVPGFAQNIFVKDTHAKFCEERDIGGRGWSQIKDTELLFTAAAQVAHKFAQPDAGASGPWRAFGALLRLCLRAICTTEPSHQVIAGGAHAPLTLPYLPSKKEPRESEMALQLTAELDRAPLPELMPALATEANGLRASTFCVFSLISIAPLKNAPSSITIRCVLTSPISVQDLRSSTRPVAVILPSTLPWTTRSRAEIPALIFPLGPMIRL